MGGRLDVQPRAQPVTARIVGARDASALSDRRRVTGGHEWGLVPAAPWRFQIGIRVAHLRQIGRPGLGVELFEQRVVARIGLRLHHAARSVPKISELDRRGRAGLLAGRFDVAVTKLASGKPRVDLHPIDPLRTVGALLHDAPRADRDVGVHRELEDVGRVLGEVEEIEATYLVGTVVRAIAGADAPVVDHHVEALPVVDGCGHRADLLAGSILAVHARNGLEDDLRAARGLAGKVPVDPEPLHLAPLRDLGLADDRHVVLALTGDHARVAPDACVQVDRHPPLVPLIVGMLLPEREVRRLAAMRAFCCSPPQPACPPKPRRRFRSKRGQGRLAHDGTPLHAAVLLGRRERVSTRELGQFGAAVEARCF